ncbi:hypothetical protein Tco_0212624 [Tanacetum coccineum]
MWSPSADVSWFAEVRIIPGSAGIVQAAKLHKITYIQEGREECVMSTHEYIRKVVEDVGEDEDFTRGSWVSVVDFVNANGGCTILGTIHHKVLIERGYGKDSTIGVSLKLHNVLEFSHKPSLHYLNITMRNLVKVFHKDTIYGNGSGISGSEMLDEEKIIKLLEEEERAEEEWQAGGNLIDQQKHQLRLDQEALIHVGKRKGKF